MQPRLIALAATVLALGAVRPDVLNAQPSSNCWFCECVSNCSCKRGGDGVTCIASGSGCTVSGNCQITQADPMMPGGTLARAENPESPSMIVTNFTSSAGQGDRSASVRESWFVLASGVMVRRDCEGRIVSRRVLPTVAQALRLESRRITL